jgi:predicted RNase H-like HicB family nuclease
LYADATCWSSEGDTHHLAILIPENTGGWMVLFPDLLNCATQGGTVPEARAMAAEATDLHLAMNSLREVRRRAVDARH